MRNVLYYGKRIVPIAGFVLMAGWLVNCNQFHSFSSNENANILSVQPVLSDNIVEQTFDGGSDVSGGNNTNNPEPNGPSGPGSVTVTGPGGNEGDPNGNNPGGNNPGGNNPGGTNPDGTNVGTPSTPGSSPVATTLQPAFLECPANNEFQLLRDDRISYTSCQRCDVFIREDQVDGQPGTCRTRIAPRPAPQVVANNNDNIWDRNAGGGDGGGDGDGDGDPLMIDTVGQTYDDIEEFSSQWFDRDNYITAGELELTSPAQGTQFNLFGDQIDFSILGKEIRIPEALAGTEEDPRNFKYQISWTQSKRYRFVVLPDENGNITGINQLFGDNTLGPDRDFAVDGFHALAKYDGRTSDGQQSVSNQDGFIDANDAIFDSLRLWVDVNDDGDVVGAEEQAAELITLRQARVKSIHLYPSTKFYERDIYGNEIVYKSVVEFEHNNSNKPGQFRRGIAFDVWFNWNPEENQKLMDTWKQQ